MADVRLIDATALQNTISEWRKKEMENDNSITGPAIIDAFGDVLDAISVAPTIDPEAPGAHRLAKYQVWHGARGDHPPASELGLCGGWQMKIILYGDPRTKKNSARILKAHANRRIVAPSEAFMQYQEKCLWQIKRPYNPITARVNVRCVYYMATRRKVDLANLIEATTDILVKARVLADDNSQIVAAHDGSRVDYDKKNPRAEIWIEEMEADT